MTKEKLAEEMKKRGYTVSDDDHVIMFSGKYPKFEDMKKEIPRILEEIGYEGSWGVRGVSKNAVVRPEPAKQITEEAGQAEEDAPVPEDDGEQMPDGDGGSLSLDNQMSLSDFM